jgi:hypothetical protein
MRPRRAAIGPLASPRRATILRYVRRWHETEGRPILGYFRFSQVSRPVADVLNSSAHDPGCVKTREAIIGAQHKNQTCYLGKVFIRERHSVRINLAPERPAEWFSHSQDP